MIKSMKKSVGLLMLALALTLAMAATVFASSHSYVFYYGNAYDDHSSGYIYGDAEVADGEVTIKLQGGNFFPALEVDGDPADRSYSAGITTFTFPGDNLSPIDVDLHVVAGPHDEWYALKIVWDHVFDE